MSPLVYSSVCADVERFTFGVLKVTFMTLIVLSLSSASCRLHLLSGPGGISHDW